MLALIGLLAVTRADEPAPENWRSWEPYQQERYEYTNYWRPYGNGPNTVALFHFDKKDALEELDANDLDKALEADTDTTFTDTSDFGTKILDPARLKVVPGKFAQGVRLDGTPFRVKAPSALLVGDRDTQPKLMIEFWLKLDALPKQPAWLIRQQLETGKRNLFELAVLPDGTIRFTSLGLGAKKAPAEGEELERRYRASYLRITSPPGVIKAGTWQHVALYTGAHKTSGYENHARISVDGEAVAAVPYGWRLGSESLPTELAFGEGLNGVLDELRICRGICRAYYPIPDDAWTDPKAKRAMPTDPKLVAPAGDVLFHAGFEGTTTAEGTEGAVEPRAAGPAVFVPGVRGRALYVQPGQDVAYPAAGNIHMDCGSVEMWVRPVGWAGDHRAQMQFLRVEGKDTWGLGVMIVNSGFRAATLIFGADARSGAGSGSRYVPWPPDTWTHVVLTWDGDDSRLYQNGEIKIAHFWNRRFDSFLKAPTFVHLPGRNPVLVDEFTVYKRALTRDEIANHYHRYFPNAELQPLRIDTTFGSALVTQFPGSGKLRVLPWWRNGEPAETVTVELSPLGGGQPVAFENEGGEPATHATCRRQRGGGYLVTGVPLRLPASSYSLVVTDAAGKRRIGASFERKDYPWLGNQLGITDRILKPYTPIKVDGKQLSTACATYTLDGLGLLWQIESNGEKLLAGPVHMEVDGRPVLAKGMPHIVEQKPNVVRWKASETVDAASGSLDYDGMVKIRLGRETLSPPGKKHTLVIPLRREFAKLYFWNGWRSETQFNVIPHAGELPAEPDADGRLFDSRRCYSDAWHPTVGSFIPQLWIGNDERGLTFLADSDKGWLPSDDVPAIELVMKDGVAELRLNLIARDDEGFRTDGIEFGLQATPVRPLPANWRGMALKVGSPKGVPLPYDPVKDLPPFGTFDVGVVDRGGIDGKPFDPEGVNQRMDEYEAANCKPVVHLDTGMFNWGALAPDCPYPDFQQEWNSNGIGFNWIFTQSKIDWGVWSHEQWRKDFPRLAGVYFDTGSIRPNYNVYSGTAYYLPDGRIQPGWTVWGQREYFRRSAHLFGDIGTENFTWGCGFYGSPFIAWQLSCNVGEQRERRPNEIYYEDVAFPFPVQRVIGVSGKWGHVQTWMPPNDPVRVDDVSKKYTRSFFGQLLQFDVRTMFTSWHFPRVIGDFQVYLPETQFHGFWNNATWWHPQAEGFERLYAGAFTRDNQILLIVTNLGPKNGWLEADLALDGLGIAAPLTYTVIDPEVRELPFANCGDYHEHYCWYRGGAAMVGYSDKPAPKGPADAVANPADELEEAPTDEQLRAVTLTQPAPGRLHLRLLVPHKDYRILWLKPAD